MFIHKKLCLIILLAASFLLWGCQTLFFHPKRSLLYTPETCAAAPENYFISTTDNLTLHAWLFRTKKPNPKGTVLFYHGNANNISTESIGMLWLLDAGYNLFTFDYRGYGASEGKPSISGILQDSSDVIDAFMEIKNIDKFNLILYGQSLGGAGAVYAAANSPYGDKFKVLIIDSTFTSWRDMAREAASKIPVTWAFQYPISWGFPDNMSSKDFIGKSKAGNILIVHSKADKLIDFSNSETLFKLANDPKQLILFDNASHASIFLSYENRKILLDYLNSKLD